MPGFTRPGPFVLFALGLVTAGSAHASADDANSATVPEARDGAAGEMHEGFLRRTKEGPVDLLFLGDSITQGWINRDGEGKGAGQVWDRYYGARRAAEYGIGGDRTQHVLWRLDHGEVDGLTPKAVVLMIGTNNIRDNTPAEIAEGITAVVAKLRDKLPGSKVLLLAVFPRSERPNALRDRVRAVNERIAKLDDGKSVKYLDIGPKFLNPDGTIPHDLMPDALHLSRKGYALWADAIEPTVRKLLGEG